MFQSRGNVKCIPASIIIGAVQAPIRLYTYFKVPYVCVFCRCSFTFRANINFQKQMGHHQKEKEMNKLNIKNTKKNQFLLY